MNKRKIAAIMLVAVTANLTAPAIPVFANEIPGNVRSLVTMNDASISATKATIGIFTLLNSSNISAYNEVFKMDNSNIESITNNGGKYFSSTLDKSIDGDFNTHWETGNPNKSDFTNEVVVKFKEVETLNRVIYAARQSTTKGKGFAREVEIYASLTDDGDDFSLVSSGEYTGSSGDVVEIKFDSTILFSIYF